MRAQVSDPVANGANVPACLSCSLSLSALPHPILNCKTTNWERERERESRGKHLGRERGKNKREELSESERDREKNISTNVV
jgi:hypothetical protein